jgi:hypothetical protein
MLFVLTPQNPSPLSYDPEEAFAAFQRRQYVAALHEQQQRAQFSRELALEEERHRIALASITQQEAARRQRQAFARFSRCAPESQSQRGFCRQPAPEEILARRLAREQEEQRRSRQFHEHILSQIFGVATGETSTEPAAAEPTTSVRILAYVGYSTDETDKSKQSSVDKGKQSTDKRPLDAPEPEPHWSAAPERARSLAEITSINRTFNSLKNTFTFPSGALERLPESDLPRLAYNATNASIHAYEHALSELLTKLDGIESHGFKGVREARKQLVVKIGKELEALETKISERLAEAASPATMTPVAIPEALQKEVEDTVMQEERPATSDAAAAAAPSGYDIEPVETQVVDEPSTATAAVSQAMEVEPLPVPAAAEQETISRPDSSTPTQPAPSEVTEPKRASSVLLEEASSDEESEIEDAVHIVIENNEPVAHDQHSAESSDQEVEFELV